MLTVDLMRDSARRRAAVALAGSVALVAAGVAVPAPAAAADDASMLRIGVLALADAISAVGQTPELADPLPFSSTSAADVLALDDLVTQDLVEALAGDADLADALAEVPGIVDVVASGSSVRFGFERSVTTDLELAYDDGDLRLGPNDGAQDLTISLTTSGDPFEVRVDPTEPDPLLRVALVSEPQLELTVTVDDTDIAAFGARQGFTDLAVSGGSYTLDRVSDITLRDPDGRSELTLEDLRYSTLPDLFRVERRQDLVDVELGVRLPDSVGVSGGADGARTGTLTLSRDGLPAPGAPVWPQAGDATRDYGAALERLTGLSMAEGMTALAEYTGAALALQNAADVAFPNLGGSTTDLFAPGDRLLEMLSTSAVAEIRCGLTPENAPSGVPGPGDTVYCDAVTAAGLGEVTAATWTSGSGAVVSDAAEQLAAAGGRPAGTVQIDGSDGEPDVTVELVTAKGTFTARTMPRTVQDVLTRIGELAGPGQTAPPAAATVDLAGDRLDVAVDLRRATSSRQLSIGNPGTLGALVGMTGLESSSGATATATATGASFDVGFAVPFADPAEGTKRELTLRPADGSLLEIRGLAASAPTGLRDLPGRVGFLGVSVDLDGVGLGGGSATQPVVALTHPGDGDLALDDLLTDEGTLEPGVLDLADALTASIAFRATERPITTSPLAYATGTTGPAAGSATVTWGPAGVPQVSFGGGYADLRVFDPVPADFLHGTATVTQGTTTVTDPDGNNPRTVSADTVEVTVDGGQLFTRLGVVPTTPGGSAEVARRLLGPGVGCQNVTVTSPTTLTCEGLAPDGEAPEVGGVPLATGDRIDLVVLGDPFALRDGVIDGLAGALNRFATLAGDNISGDGIVDDQYTSTLPLVDLTPAQLATERDSLGRGLAKLVDAATEDETTPASELVDPDGNPVPVGSFPPVSSAQELSLAVPSLVGAGASIGYTLTGSGPAPGLGVALQQSAGTRTFKAPLRFVVEGTGQVVGTRDVDVLVDSATTLDVDVDTATARAAVAEGSGTTSRARLQAPVSLGGRLQAGVGELEVVTSGSSAFLDVVVTTVYDADPDGDSATDDGALRTTRTRGATAPPPAADFPGAGPATAAAASLDVSERDENLTYAARATDSSGGTGAVQPDPEPMETKFLAEGLDGLASALDSALDGAAPRNAGPHGAPVALPLVGTELDAGTDIGAQLTGLTSLLRTRLAAMGVDADTTATELEDAVEQAATLALASSGDTISGSGVAATVTCGDEPCVPKDPDDPEAAWNDGPTAWDTVTLEMDLTGDTVTGETPFETGLAGLEVRSDQMVSTEAGWTLPVTLELVRGVGPRVSIADGDALDLDLAAELPRRADVPTAPLGAATTARTCTEDKTHCIPAVVGYLPAMVSTDSAADGAVAATVQVAPSAGAYDLFDLYDGKLDARPAFADDGGAEQGVALDFETVASDAGAFDLTGTVDVPWTPAGGFGTVSYTGVKLDVGEVIATLAKPFAVVDPYLGPARDVIDVLRTPIPVVSDLSELGGGGEISLLSLLDKMGGADKRLELAMRVVAFVETAVKITGAIAPFAAKDVPVEDLAAAGALLTVEPSELELASSCTQTVRTSTTTTTPPGGPVTPPKKTKSVTPCPDEETGEGVKGQSTAEKRKGNRNTSTSVAKTTKTLTGSAPGFSLPFLADPDQLVDVLTGEGEATYFRLDFGSLVAEVAYTQSFGPIMAGPVPIKPFVGGSISVEGRLAVGFDSMPQTLAVRRLSHPGDITGLREAYDEFAGKDILEEGFYIDDLDAEGVDVPEVKLVTTLEAGAGVSIGIVTAGLKGGVVLTINLDLNDPDDDGRLRTAEIRNVFAGDPSCIFDASADISAFIAVFVEIDLFVEKLEYSFDLLRLGPYTIFEYGCPDLVPTLVVQDGDSIALTSGTRDGQRNVPAFVDIAEDYEVRQFDESGGMDGGGTTVFEVSALDRVQRLEVRRGGSKNYVVTVFKTAAATSFEPQGSFDVTDVDFLAAGRDKDDKLSFLTGETFDGDRLVTTDFSVPVRAVGNGGDDLIVTGVAADHVQGGAGDDDIDTGLGDDTVAAGSGADVVNGGAGRDDLAGDDGADRLQGGPGADRVDGGAGDDSVVGGPGRDTRAVLVAVGDTESEIAANVRAQVRLGFDSGDVLLGGPGRDAVDGGDGSDVVVGGTDSTLASPTALGDLFGPGSRDVNVLSKGATNPVTTPVDVDTARVPDDAALDDLCESGEPLGGAGGGDLVTGGPEKDVVIGSNGADDLDGGGGPDEICGLAGDDQISGDGGSPAGEVPAQDRDVVRGGHGDDRVEAGPGPDVVFGDDVRLVRAGVRVLDGSLGDGADGAGRDYLDGGEGGDVLSGGGGSDLILSGAGDDVSSGEGLDTGPSSADPGSVGNRLVACNQTTRVVRGYVDLDGDLLAGPLGADLDGVTADDGRLAGLPVSAGRVMVLGSSSGYTGLVGDTVVIDGRVDLDRDGVIGRADTGTVPLASMLAPAADNPAGDCVLGGDGEDQLAGGTGSDHLAAGAGVDLLEGGDGHDLMLGDAGTDVLLGGRHHDVLVGGDGADQLQGGQGDDRLRGNDGDDDLVGGRESSGAADGADLLIGGRGEDVLAGDNARVVSAPLATAVAAAAWAGADAVPASALATGEDFADSAVVCGTDPADRSLTLLVGAAPSTDELYGGYGCDWVFGQDGDDLVRGGQDDDVVEAGPGADTAYGDAGDDVVVGGSSVDPAVDSRVTVERSGAGAPDQGDTIDGDGGPDGEVGADLLLGDNARPVRLPGSAAYTVELFDVTATSWLAAGSPAGADTIRGDGAGPVVAGSAEDRIFGQGGDDLLLDGGEGDDYVEGGTGADQLRGGPGDDDLVGGSSATDGWPLGRDGQRLGARLTALVDTSAAGLADGADTVLGDSGEDVVLGDNGRITRPGGTLTSSTSTQAVRQVAMADSSPGSTSGSDQLYGGDGDDVVYGQLDDSVPGSVDPSAWGDGDLVEGGLGHDALLGDLGVVTPTLADELSGERSLESPADLIVETVYENGTLVPVTRVPAELVAVGGSDVLRGGGDDDVLRGGAATDLLNGDSGDDVVLGGAGDDALWGGVGHDRLFGGYGADRLDLKVSTGDAAAYAEVAGSEDTDGDVATGNGADLAYGGWGPDLLQADQGGAGPEPGQDHLVDWVGNHNVYYVCDGAYGSGRVVRQSSPAMMTLLRDLVVAAGGTDLTAGGSGWTDLGLVANADKSANSKPTPGAPGNFTCQ